MSNSKTCLRCGGTRLEPGVLNSTGRIHFQPENAKVFSLKSSDVKLQANICLDCGTLDLVADFQKAEALVGGRAKPV